jgi:agmatine deiminase
VELVAAISQFEPVEVLAGTSDAMASATSMLDGVANVTLRPIPTNDSWIRDNGPCFLVPTDATAAPALLDWEFNSWGNKYPPFDLDNAVPARIAELTGHQRFCPGIVLEGGAIDGNGDGIVLTTKSCLLNPNRNSAMAASKIEEYLCRYVGAKQVIWLDGEIPGDDTDGHVDQIARFVNPTTVLLCDNAENDMATQNMERLRTAGGDIVSDLTYKLLPAPTAQWLGNHRLPASYANFYLVNDGVIVPTFGDPADDEACATVAACQPNRRVVALRVDHLIAGLGAVHCLTQQEPDLSSSHFHEE